MSSFFRVFALTMLVLLCFGGRCKPNPARPAKLDRSSLTSKWHEEFYARLGDPEQRWYGAILYTRQDANGLTVDDGKAAACIYKPITQDDQMMLGIYYNPEEQTDPPPMQLQLLARSERWIGEYGDPVVFCDLDYAQARKIIDSGNVPDSLVAEMVKTAKEANWRKELPAPQQFGGFVEVSAEGHFDEVQGEVPDDQAASQPTD